MRTLIGASNVNQPKGNFDGPTRVSMLDANDQLRSPEEYANLILAYNNGAPLRLKDVPKSSTAPRTSGWPPGRTRTMLCC